MKLESFGVNVIVAGKDKVSIPLLLDRLWKIKIKTVLLEGGGKTNWEFVSRGLVDSLIVTISPRLLDPYAALVHQSAAISLDGKIASVGGDSKLSSCEDSVAQRPPWLMESVSSIYENLQSLY